MRPRKRVEVVEHRGHDRDHDQQRQHFNAAEVELVGMAAQEVLHALAKGKPDAGAGAQLFAPSPIR